jgi:hypothetical protein
MGVSTMLRLPPLLERKDLFFLDISREQPYRMVSKTSRQLPSDGDPPNTSSLAPCRGMASCKAVPHESEVGKTPPSVHSMTPESCHNRALITHTPTCIKNYLTGKPDLCFFLSETAPYDSKPLKTILIFGKMWSIIQGNGLQAPSAALPEC